MIRQMMIETLDLLGFLHKSFLGVVGEVGSTRLDFERLELT